MDMPEIVFIEVPLHMLFGIATGLGQQPVAEILAVLLQQWDVVNKIKIFVFSLKCFDAVRAIHENHCMARDNRVKKLKQIVPQIMAQSSSIPPENLSFFHVNSHSHTELRKRPSTF